MGGDCLRTESSTNQPCGLGQVTASGLMPPFSSLLTEVVGVDDPMLNTGSPREERGVFIFISLLLGIGTN